MNKIDVLKSSYISSYLIWSVGAVNMEKSQLKKGVEKNRVLYLELLCLKIK